MYSECTWSDGFCGLQFELLWVIFARLPHCPTCINTIVVQLHKEVDCRKEIVTVQMVMFPLCKCCDKSSTTLAPRPYFCLSLSPLPVYTSKLCTYPLVSTTLLYHVLRAYLAGIVSNMNSPGTDSWPHLPLCLLIHCKLR